MKGQALRDLVEGLGPVGTLHKIQECFEKRLLAVKDFSLKELAEAFLGRDAESRFNHEMHKLSVRGGGAWTRTREDKDSWFSERDIQEAGEAIDVSAFAAITGQLFFNKILQGWENAVMIGESLVTNMPTRLDGERMPWIGHAVSEGQAINPGMPYPETAWGQRYIDTPHATKEGEIISLTKEAVFFDLTGQMMKGAEELGKRLGYNKEKQILRTVMGIDNSYSLNGAAANTYQTSAGASPNTYINSQASTPLVDWTSIQNYYILAANILDPDTKNPIITKPKQLLVMPAMFMTAKRIVAATQVRSTFPAFQASAAAPGNVQMISDSPLPDTLEVLSSSIALQLLLGPGGLSATQANNNWWIGDFAESFYWMENWPFTIQQAPANNIKDFEQDIVMRWKGSFRGTPAVIDPRYVQKFYNT